MPESFVHLHVHTQYSLMGSTIRVKTLPKALKANHSSTCAITDTATMFGAVEFYLEMQKEECKPIIGMAAAIAKESRLQREYLSGESHYSQTILLCQNKKGYQNLIRIASLGYTEGKYRGVARIDHELLEQYQEGLIALSGGMQGEIAQAIQVGKYEEAIKLAAWYKEVFADRYYIEIQRTGLSEQEDVNPYLIQIAQELKIPLVATNACRYLHQEEAHANYILQLMGLQKRITDSNIPSMKTNQLFFRTPEEMQELFSDLPEAISNTVLIADQCEVALQREKYYLPEYEIPPSYTLDSWFRKDSATGLQKRLDQLYPLYQPQESFEEFRKRYDERLEFELNIIISMGFAGYFFNCSGLYQLVEKQRYSCWTRTRIRSRLFGRLFFTDYRCGPVALWIAL